MFRTLISLIIFIFPSICLGDYDWKLITKSDNGDFYVDMKSLTIKNDKRFFLRLRDYKKLINMVKNQTLSILKQIVKNSKQDF